MVTVLNTDVYLVLGKRGDEYRLVKQEGGDEIYIHSDLLGTTLTHLPEGSLIKEDEPLKVHLVGDKWEYVRFN